jgi:hypothetical protein
VPYRLKPGERYAGHMGLLQRFGLDLPAPPVVSIVGAGTRRSLVESGQTVERYLAGYDYGDSATGDIKFALRYEPVDLRILNAAFHRLDPADLEVWIEREATGIFSRRAWFLYEHLTGRPLSLPDSGPVRYIPALDPERHIVRPNDRSDRSRRHHVLDNLPGSPAFCPIVRRTAKLDGLMATPVAAEARIQIERHDPDILRRAVRYLYTKETRSSFEIEGEEIDDTRAERFVRALQSAKDFDPTEKADYIELQNLIISNPRFHARDWRDNQNFIGSVGGGYRQTIDYVCPRPQDVAALMDGLGAMAARLRRTVDPLIAAALLSFGFVFIHPFEDGNGRIHRYLVHRVLADEGVTPPDVLFPISAAMIRDRAAYDAALEGFSATVVPFIDWRWAGGVVGGEIEVLNDTRDLYRFFDATAQAEYLYERVIETVRKDLREELDFVETYDWVYRALSEHLDGLPDHRVSLLVVLCLQNGGRLSKGKYRLFPQLGPDDIADVENIVRVAISDKAVKREL